jgi:hypothetical protein
LIQFFSFSENNNNNNSQQEQYLNRINKIIAIMNNAAINVKQSTSHLNEMQKLGLKFNSANKPLHMFHRFG